MDLLNQFLREHRMTVTPKLKESIAQHIEKYFSSSQENTRHYQDHIANVYSSSFQDYDCLCFQKDPLVSQALERCYRCGKLCHVGCFWGNEGEDELYECPMCFLRHCIPNRHVERVLFAGYLRQIQKDKVEYKINFPLELGHAEDWSI